MSPRTKAVVTGLVALHFAATVWHGHAHRELGVTLPPVTIAFVYVVIVLLPIIAACLVWTPKARSGVWLFSLSMAASFLFGVYHHVVRISADHIRHLPGGSAATRTAFILSAGGLALLELGAASYGIVRLRGPRGTASRGGS